MSTAVIPRAGLEERRVALLLERARLDGQIAELDFWIALCEEKEKAG
jgi:hypothetical protein